MASRRRAQDGARFRVRPAAPRARSSPGSQRFITQVLKAVTKAGAKASQGKGARPPSTFGRGRVAAGMAGARLSANARRVVIKSRFVVLKKAGSRSVAAHMLYIERDGTTRDGQRGQAYGANTNAADLQAFEERGRSDRHQFRFIVSVEDASELEDLRGYTRELMARMEVDLESHLDWVAVDHWDTDNPHSHVVLRGKVEQGREQRDLVIAPDYMAHSMRHRASELATQWLGPRTELEMQKGMLREVDQERMTGLDRALLRQTMADIVDLTKVPSMASGTQRRALLRARLQRLETMALAEQVDANCWRLAVGMEQKLVAMSERGDILRTMHRAMKGEPREFVIASPENLFVVGCVAAKGLDGDLHERPYLVIDAIDGRAHYLKLPVGTDLGGWPIGAIVEAKPPTQERAVDRNILAASRDGIYATASHRAQLVQAGERDPQATVEVHVRRLEALGRSGIVQRVGEGVWAVTPHLLEKARKHDARKAAGHPVELRSHLPIEQQVTAVGATWLDRNLTASHPEDRETAMQGFGAQVREATVRRLDFLTQQGLTQHKGQRIFVGRNLLATLRDRELALVGQKLQQQSGKTWRPVLDGQRISGRYSQSVQLVSGRFALLEDGLGFSLVAWRAVIEPRLGQQVSCVLQGGSVTWQFSRQRGIT